MDVEAQRAGDHSLTMPLTRPTMYQTNVHFQVVLVIHILYVQADAHIR